MTRSEERYSATSLSATVSRTAMNGKYRKESRFSSSVNLQAPPPPNLARLCSASPHPEIAPAPPTRFPPSPACISEVEGKRTCLRRHRPACLGLSFPREHSCWNLQLSASSTPCYFILAGHISLDEVKDLACYSGQ